MHLEIAGVSEPLRVTHAKGGPVRFLRKNAMSLYFYTSRLPWCSAACPYKLKCSSSGIDFFRATGGSRYLMPEFPLLMHHNSKIVHKPCSGVCLHYNKHVRACDIQEDEFFVPGIIAAVCSEMWERDSILKDDRTLRPSNL